MSDVITKNVVTPRYTTMMPKRALQALLKQCRKSGMEVERRNGIYFVTIGDDLVLRALDGRRSYLVMASTQYFERMNNVVEA